VQIATLAHELGHVYCGHIGGHPKGHWPARQGMPNPLRELEAEAVAWLVCGRRGIEPNSPDYLHTLVPKVNLADVSMFSIYSAANRVEAGAMATRRAGHRANPATTAPAASRRGLPAEARGVSRR